MGRPLNRRDYRVCYVYVFFSGGLDFADELKDRGMIGPVNTTGIKFIPSKPHNPQKYGLPRANAVIIILDEDTLMPACIMDGTLVSAMRTGAASGVAAKYLVNSDSKVMGLVGASVQGITQTLAIKEGVQSLEICKVFDLNKDTPLKFVNKMKDLTDMEILLLEIKREEIIKKKRFSLTL